MPLVQPKSVVSGVPMSVMDVLKAANKVPVYQRDYVWQQKQVGQLLQDVFDHFDRYTKKEEFVEPEGHFLGAMVVIENDPSDPFEVVDGQQRLGIDQAPVDRHVSGDDVEPHASGVAPRAVWR